MRLPTVRLNKDTTPRLLGFPGGKRTTGTQVNTR
jgi:hypothetical protein